MHKQSRGDKMISDTCSKCVRQLNKSEIKKRVKSCHICISTARVELIQTTSFLNTNFNKKWSVTLFKNYILYLSELNVKVDTIRKNGSKVLRLFQLAEKEHLEVFNINEEWLLRTIEINGNFRGIKSSFFNFLIVSFNSSTIYEDKPVSNRLLLKKVKDLTNFIPKAHRITCFNVIASNYGLQLLVEGFGVSLTQASIYGKLENHLIKKNKYHI